MKDATAFWRVTFRIDWGDKTVQDVSGPTASHVYSTPGTSSIIVNVVDSAGNVSPNATIRRVTISPKAVSPKEENLNVRLEAALKIQVVFDRDPALARVAKEAAAAGLATLVTKAVAAVGPLNKDDVAADSAAELAKVGQRKAALEIAQMIRNNQQTVLCVLDVEDRDLVQQVDVLFERQQHFQTGCDLEKAVKNNSI
jgi:hypothetical protein